MELNGFIKETVRGISKTECQDRCLSENSYSCKSASYDHMRQECHLSTEDRFTQPKSFLAKQGTDYLENQCESSKFYKKTHFSQMKKIVMLEIKLIQSVDQFQTLIVIN